jgi:hypothetical protein
MPRLNKGTRETIALAAADKQYAGNLKDAEACMKRLAGDLYDARLWAQLELSRDALLALVKKAKKAYLALPDGTRGWGVIAESAGRIDVDGWRTDLPESLPKFEGMNDGGVLAPENTVFRAAVAAAKTVDAVTDQRKELYADTLAVLQNFNSTERLLKEWPEIEELVPTSAKTSNVPAVPVQKLNERIGLPSGAR